MNRKEFIENLNCTFNDCIKLIDAKNADYASSEDPFLNFRAAEKNGIATVETAMLVRMQDKWARIINLIKKDEPAKVLDETVDDTILDMINYLAILRAYRKEKNDKNVVTTEVPAELIRPMSKAEIKARKQYDVKQEALAKEDKEPIYRNDMDYPNYFDISISKIEMDMEKGIPLATMGENAMKGVRMMSKNGGGEIVIGIKGVGVALADYIEQEIKKEKLTNIIVKRK